MSTANTVILLQLCDLAPQSAARAAQYDALVEARDSQDAIAATFRDFYRRDLVTSPDWHDATLTDAGKRKLIQSIAYVASHAD